MGEVLVIRHGETEWNRAEVFRGRSDVPLSEGGREQARLVAEVLKERPIEAVYSSPLSRARDTAQPLAEALGLDVVVDERLVDMSFGQWEGWERTRVEREQPERYELWLKEPERFRAPGGESLAEVRARAWPAVQELAERHGVCAIVSHRVVCKVVLCEALGSGAAGFWRVRVDTGSVSVVRREGGGWLVTAVNDTHHLKAMGAGDAVDF